MGRRVALRYGARQPVKVRPVEPATKRSADTAGTAWQTVAHDLMQGSDRMVRSLHHLPGPVVTLVPISPRLRNLLRFDPLPLIKRRRSWDRGLGAARAIIERSLGALQRHRQTFLGPHSSSGCSYVRGELGHSCKTMPRASHCRPMHAALIQQR